MQLQLSLLALLALPLWAFAAPTADAEAIANPVPEAVAEAVAEPIAIPDYAPYTKPRYDGPDDTTKREPDGGIFARACSYNTGCRSVSGVKAGKYCGYCYEVDAGNKWVGTHVYQLNGKSGKQGCCDYGYNNDCAREYDAGTWNRKYCPK